MYNLVDYINRYSITFHLKHCLIINPTCHFKIQYFLFLLIFIPYSPIFLSFSTFTTFSFPLSLFFDYLPFFLLFYTPSFPCLTYFIFPSPSSVPLQFVVSVIFNLDFNNLLVRCNFAVLVYSSCDSHSLHLSLINS